MQTSIFLKKSANHTAFYFYVHQHLGQNVGIGTALPKARLYGVDSSVLFCAPFALPAVAGPSPVHGAATAL